MQDGPVDSLRPVRALVIGCGAVGSEYDRESPQPEAPRSHAGAYAQSERTALAGGVDPDPAARARFSELWDVPCYASVDEALAACEPEVASICTPPEARQEVLLPLLEANVRAIWMEKPLADTVTAGEEIVAACNRRGVALQVNFLRRFDSLHAHVAQEVSGQVLHADFRYNGTLENYGSHAIDLFRWFVGEPIRVTALAEGSNVALIELLTADGRMGTLRQLVGSSTPLFDCDLWLSDCRYTLTAGGEQLLVANVAPSALFRDVARLRFGEPSPGVGLEDAMSSGLKLLLERFEHGLEPVCSGRDGVAELRIRAAVLRSLELGVPVAVETGLARVRP
jgi:hypothetical protein